MTVPRTIGESGISQKSSDNDLATCDTELPCNHYINYDLGGTYNITKVRVLTTVGSETSLKIFAQKTNASNLCYDGTSVPLDDGVYNELDCVKDNRQFITIQVTSDCSLNNASLCDVQVYRKCLYIIKKLLIKCPSENNHLEAPLADWVLLS